MGELTGCARCPAIRQDLPAQHEILNGPGVPDDRIYRGKGLTGTSRARHPYWWARVFSCRQFSAPAVLPVTLCGPRACRSTRRAVVADAGVTGF